MNEQQFEQSLQRLEKELQPTRDLWPDIATRLAQTSQHQSVDVFVAEVSAAKASAAKEDRFWLTHWVGAAALLLVALIGWQMAVMPTPGQPTANAASAELLLLQVYEQQKARQLAQVVAIAEGFDNWQQQLVIWDQAIAQVRRALQFYPDEPQLLAQLQQLYQQQLRYIQQATLQHPLITR
ncbi:MAG: hypothetical protein CML20_04545 [Rheinheimera sp.]|uniref:hypothetical protein n=1 Tax=Arsukibacterium sp. UBA3155 TaxID=1946058 RepID=UPI000C8DF160|nr:hypothetical protein [Arsukibacterium sp. UBA3155]MAD74059.1 hypothetical protein [Rheinheimera sp.]|tara:strand:- start:125970 stop:126512 length:543 start_codon:yes stop_codon:yes gene_type:complete